MINYTINERKAAKTAEKWQKLKIMATTLEECKANNRDREYLSLLKSIEKKKKMKTVKVGRHVISYTKGKGKEMQELIARERRG